MSKHAKDYAAALKFVKTVWKPATKKLKTGGGDR